MVVVNAAEIELMRKLCDDPFATEAEARGSQGVLFTGAADEDDTELEDTGDERGRGGRSGTSTSLQQGSGALPTKSVLPNENQVCPTNQTQTLT